MASGCPTTRASSTSEMAPSTSSADRVADRDADGCRDRALPRSRSQPVGTFEVVGGDHERTVLDGGTHLPRRLVPSTTVAVISVMRGHYRLVRLRG